MNCILCNGKTNKEKVEYKEGGIMFGTFSAEVCDQCGEQFFDEKTATIIQQKSKEHGLFGIARRAKIAEVGTSLAIRIPKDLAERLHLTKGKEVVLLPQGNRELVMQA